MLVGMKAKELLPYIAIIFIVGGYALLSIPHPVEYSQTVASGGSGGEWSIEGIATCIIAVFAIFQYFEFRSSSERLARAYLMIEKARIENVEAGKSPIAIITLKNFGQTPAYEFTQWANMGTDYYPHRMPIPMEDTDDPLPATAIGPGGQYLTMPSRDKTLNAHEIDGLAKGEIALYVIGRIRYRDAFNKKRVTEYCLIAGGPIGIDGSLAAYSEGNYAN